MNMAAVLYIGNFSKHGNFYLFILLMEFSVRNSSFSVRRPQSSCGGELRSAKIATKGFLIRDDYKQKMLIQRENDLAVMRKYKKNLDKRSAKRFSNSPFAVNVLADNEINEHQRNLVSFKKKTRSMSKVSRKVGFTHKYLTRLRAEIKKLDEGII